MGNSFAVARGAKKAQFKAVCEARDEARIRLSNSELELMEQQAKVDQDKAELKRYECLVRVLLKLETCLELSIDNSDFTGQESAENRPPLTSVVESRDPLNARDMLHGLTCPEPNGRQVPNDAVGRSLRWIHQARPNSAGEDDKDIDDPKALPSSMLGGTVNIHDELSEMSITKSVIIGNERPSAAEQLHPVLFLAIANGKNRGRLCEALRDTGAEVNAIAKGYAKWLGACFYESDIPTLVAPWGGGGRIVETKSHCWLSLKLLGERVPYVVEFCVFEDKIMGDKRCILSVKTCIKASLIQDGLVGQGQHRM